MKELRGMLEKSAFKKTESILMVIYSLLLFVAISSLFTPIGDIVFISCSCASIVMFSLYHISHRR
jgi:hypothetical protein